MHRHIQSDAQLPNTFLKYQEYRSQNTARHSFLELHRRSLEHVYALYTLFTDLETLKIVTRASTDYVSPLDAEVHHKFHRLVFDCPQ